MYTYISNVQSNNKSDLTCRTGLRWGRSNEAMHGNKIQRLQNRTKSHQHPSSFPPPDTVPRLYFLPNKQSEEKSCYTYPSHLLEHADTIQSENDIQNSENWTFKHCPRYGITTTIITLTNATSNLLDEVFHHLYTISPACPVKWSHVIATITFISTSSMGNKRLYNLKATPFTSCV